MLRRRTAHQATTAPKIRAQPTPTPTPAPIATVLELEPLEGLGLVDEVEPVLAAPDDVLTRLVAGPERCVFDPVFVLVVATVELPAGTEIQNWPV